MTPIHEQFRTICSNSAPTLLDEMKLSGDVQVRPGAKKAMNSELWHACAGPLVSLPQPGSLVYYFPQGHSEQVTASTRKTANSHIANYPNLPSQLMCQVHNVTLHADKDTDEIYAQMTLQPVKSESDVFPVPDFGHTRCKQPSDFFCKNLTASDTSTHGGFSVPRRSAEKLFPQLDYSMQPPNQELIVRDLHDNLWTFRHIYRGQPKRHLLTTGWSLFVGAKRLKAGDSVLFIRDDKSQLLVGVRRANRQQTSLPSSVLSADSMHMGVLAAAAHAAASLSPFTVYYNPRACSSEFIVPLAKYHKAAYTQVSVGMRYGMMFETEESIKRRYMGTIVGIGDYDPLKWPKSKWRNLQVEWDEHGYGERPDRVNLWEIETPESLFIFPTQNSSLKRQCLPGFAVPGTGIGFGNAKPLYQTPENGNGILHPLISGLGSEQLMEVLLKSQTPIPDSQLGSNQSIYASILQNIRNNDISRSFSSTMPSFCAARSPIQQEEQVNKFMMQHKYQLHPVQQQTFPLQLQNQKPHNCVEQPGGGLDCASWEHMKPQEQFKSLPEQKFQENESNERNFYPTGSKRASSIIQSTSGEKSDTTSVLVRNQVDENSQGKRKTPSQQHSESLNQLSEKHTGQNLMRSAGLENLVAPLLVGQGTQVKEEAEPELGQRQLEPATAPSPWLDTAHSLEKNIPNNLLAEGYHSQYLDQDSWMTHPSCYQPFSGNLKTPEFPSRSGKTDAFIFPAPENTSGSSADISSIVFPETFNLVETLQFSGISDSQSPQSLPNFIQGFFGAQELNPLHEVVAPGFLPFEVHDLPVQEEVTVLQDMSNSCGLRDSSDDSNNQSVTYSNLHFEASKGSKLASSCVSSTVLEAFSTARGSGFHGPEDLVGNFTSNQDMQSQITSASLTDSQVFSLQEIPDSSGGASSGSIDVNEYTFLNRDPSKHVSQQRLRTYTKVQKLGSVGRSIDVSRFRNYNELTSAIACMFGLEGQLGDPRGSDWKLVYVDYENDVLLVGDDPWEEFVNCVRCIRILSPSEVQQMSQGGVMSQGGMQLMNCHLPPGQ